MKILEIVILIFLGLMLLAAYLMLLIISFMRMSLWFQLLYTYLYESKVYDAYLKIKREGCVYYASYEDWVESPTYKTGNEIVGYGDYIGVYIEGELVITDFFNKMTEDLIRRSERRFI